MPCFHRQLSCLLHSLCLEFLPRVIKCAHYSNWPLPKYQRNWKTPNLTAVCFVSLRLYFHEMVFHKVLKCNLGKLFLIYTHSDKVWQKLNLNLRDIFSRTEPTPSSVNSKLESNQFNKCLSRSLQSWVDQGRVNAVQGWVDGSIKKFSAPLMAWNQPRHHHPQNYCNELPNDNMIIDQDHNYHDPDRIHHHHRHLHHYCPQNHHGCQWRWCQKIAAGSELLPQNWVYKSNLDLLWNVKVTVE